MSQFLAATESLFLVGWGWVDCIAAACLCARCIAGFQCRFDYGLDHGGYSDFFSGVSGVGGGIDDRRRVMLWGSVDSCGKYLLKNRLCIFGEIFAVGNIIGFVVSRGLSTASFYLGDAEDEVVEVFHQEN